MKLSVYLQPLCNPRTECRHQLASVFSSHVPEVHKSLIVHAALLQLGITQAMQYVGPHVMAATYQVLPSYSPPWRGW